LLALWAIQIGYFDEETGFQISVIYVPPFKELRVTLAASMNEHGCLAFYHIGYSAYHLV
jgi:hypothetical protein